MATVWYPARNVECHPPAPWMPDGALEAFLTDQGFSDLIPWLRSLPAMSALPCGSWADGCPSWCSRTARTATRATTTLMVQELASHGYACRDGGSSIRHVHRVPRRPGRRPAPRPKGSDAAGGFRRDLRFVLDCVEQLAAGRNPDLAQRELPAGLLGSLDPRRIGAFGWSKGGTATACAMLADDRIRAGLSLDGPMQ